MERADSKVVEWGVAGRQMPGQVLSGDLYLVKPLERGVLFAVADGLGHGQPAAEAARLALKAVAEYSKKPLVQALEYCSRQMRETRGAVITLAFFNPLDDSLQWLGVGNVEGVLVRSGSGRKRRQESLFLRPGVLGNQLPALRAGVMNISPGDTLVLATDGIRRGFGEKMDLFKNPETTAQDILARYALETDDALVLVATYRGRRP